MNGLNVNDLMAMHRDAINEGPMEEQSVMDAVRDEGTLDYIVERSNHINDFVERSAYLLYSIASLHPFMEGNKRTALIASTSIIFKFGYRLDETKENFNQFLRKVASDEIKEKEIVIWIKKRMKSFTK